MSKASEWADRAAEIDAEMLATRVKYETRPRFTVPMYGGQAVAGEADDRGNLLLGGPRIVLTPAQAIEFAQWLLDTFGEQS